MQPPLEFLAPAIDLIGRNASVLPATGGAFEDMARPDVEEADDRFFGASREAQEGFQDFAETPLPDWRHLYRSTPPIFRSTKHVFRYFCDGSIKTYFLGTIMVRRSLASVMLRRMVWTSGDMRTSTRFSKQNA